MCDRRDLGSHPDVKDLAVDADAGDLWVGMKKVLRRYDANGALMVEISLDKLAYLASDHQGGVWLATDKELFRIDRFGRVLAATTPFDDHDKIVALATDPTDSSVWVASKNALSHRHSDGHPLHNLKFKGEIRDLAFYADVIPPTLTLVAPHDGTALSTNTPSIELQYRDSGAGVDPATLVLQANNVDVAVSCRYSEAGTTCTPARALPEGRVTLTATIQDYAGNTAEPATVTFTVDTIPPVITVTAPIDGTLTNQPLQTFVGSLSEAATLTLNGTGVHVGPNLAFSHGPLSLQEGFNTFELIAADAVGNSSHRNVRVTLDTVPPAAVEKGKLTVSDVSDRQVRVSGLVGSVESGTKVTLTNTRTGQTVTVTASSDGSFMGTIVAQGGDVVSILATDRAGNVSAPSTVAVRSALPPDPGTIAPPLNRTVATDLASATAFLYTGSQPIQTGVAQGTIEARRVAVLRGLVQTREGTPLPGVTITILGHAEYGQTLTRADGLFDMAVNGGGRLTVRYEKDHYVPVQRQVQAPWRDYAWLPDVVMLPYDPQVTTIDLTASADIQAARGSVVTDADGTRQATLLIAPGTQATMVLPDGTTQPLTTLHVRATEYTTGPNGPAALPGELPPTSAYTYAVELSVDEAVVAGAQMVRFTQPVIVYVENFLGFPVGEIVPAGYYDRQRGMWVASNNGRVIRVLSHADGLAAVDIDGDSLPDDPSGLLALGITEAERQRLASLYQPGQSLWRVPVTHFTPWDLNWPAAGTFPNQPLATPDSRLESCADSQGGSIIGCQNQSLGEVVPVTGTPFHLRYQSDRVPGRTAERTLHIALTGETTNVIGMTQIYLYVDVAGQRVAKTFAPAPNLTYTFTWDGRDGYGREVQGEYPVTISVGHYYDLCYRPAAPSNPSFGLTSGASGGGSWACRPVFFWRQQRATVVGSWDSRGQGLGAWTLNVHHAYDLMGKTLYMGDGTRRSAENLGQVITAAAGHPSGGYMGYAGDGGPATAASLGYPSGLAVGSDGSLYIADAYNSRIRRVSPDGMITTVAGIGVNGYGVGYSGDGGPATQAQLNYPGDVAIGPDGSLYIADSTNHRVRRVGLDGIITTVAGNGMAGSGGDGGLATQAQLNFPYGLTVGPDASLYVAEYRGQRVRRVGPDRIITTVAGTGTPGYAGDGGPATAAQLYSPWALAVGPDGSLYIADISNNCIRRVSPDGRITTVAGNGTSGHSGDGGPATQAQFRRLYRLAVGPDGSLYIVESRYGLPDAVNGPYGAYIRRVRPDGIITTVAGSTAWGDSGDGGLATQASFGTLQGIAIGPDGSLYLSDDYFHRVRRVGPPLPDFALNDLLIPSQDSREVYVFDAQGRHLRTLNALTGAVQYQFRYDSTGRLVQIVDGDGQTTTIERDGAGSPTAIVAHFGQRTTVRLDDHGYLASVASPAGETIRLMYTADGLLSSLTNPKGNQYRFSYDPLGRLLRDDDPAGGFKALSRTGNADSYTVSLVSALGRAYTYAVDLFPTGDTRRVNTDPRGLQTIMERGTDGRHRVTSPDSTVMMLTTGPDPRFGMQAPGVSSLTVATPRGLTSTLTETRSVTLTSALDIQSLSSATTTVTLNGRAYTSTFNAASRKITSRTPAGRQRVTTIDTQGRVLEEQLAGLDALRFTYDALGRPATVAQGSQTSVFSYDAHGYLASITDSLARIVRFEYDLIGRLTRQTLPDGREISYTYDANGNVTSITPPGRPSHAFSYTAVDLAEDYMPPDMGLQASLTHYAYNLDRQLVQVTRPDGATIDLSYDGSGRLSRLMSPRGQTSYAYDPSTGNLATITAPNGSTLTYDYDGSLLTSETWSGTISGTVQRTYDNNFRIVSQSVNGGSSATFQYDPDGLLTQAGVLTLSRDPQHGLITGTTLGNVADTWAYNRFGELASYKAIFSGSDLYATQYVRDPLGRITQKTETIDGQTNAYTYAYDPAGRLTEIKRDGSTVATYFYDSNGNRLSSTDVSGTVTGSYDVQDRLTQYGSITYTYTANGELQGKTAAGQTTTYTYDALDNLTAVTLPNGTQIEYVIDGRHRRVGKKVNGALVQGFLYNGGLTPVAELDGSGNVTARFIYGTRSSVPDYLIKGGITYRIITDHLGSPRLVIDTSTGHIVQRLAYDTFGRVTFDDNPGFQPFGFAGGLYDPDTKLTRFGARDYDAETGRWTAKDPILFSGGDTNLYGYVLNDPVNWLDPWGLEFGSAEEGQRIVEVASRWIDTPYIFGGKSREGADCSGSTWAIYKEAGFPYKYLPSASFPNSPSFRPSPDNIPQVGDVGRWNGHMVIYDPNAPNGNNVWTAHRTGGPPYGPYQFERYNKIYGSVTWYRYYKPD
jgi:RHS repeat-associated protein